MWSQRTCASASSLPSRDLSRLMNAPGCQCNGGNGVASEDRFDFNLVALLSAVGEAKPQTAWQVNIGALMNSLEVARQYNCALFTPSSIGAFGPSSPKDKTPQDTVMRPTTMYGVCKVTGEMLGDYYHSRFGVDTRSVRFPGVAPFGPVGTAGSPFGTLRTFGTFRAFLRLVPGIVEITGVAGLSGRMAFDGHGEILVRRSEVWPRYGCLPHRNGKRTVM